MAEERKGTDAGLVAVAAVGAAAFAAIAVGVAAAAARPSPKPPPPVEGCVRSPKTGGFVVRCFEKGPTSLMEFVMDQPFYVEDFFLGVDLTGIGAHGGVQHDQVSVGLLFFDESGRLKKRFDFPNLPTPSKFSEGALVGMIAKSMRVEALFTGNVVAAFGPSELTLTKNGRLVMNVR